MRERYESLAALVLKDLAKARGIKGASAMKKADLIEAMLAKDVEEATAEEKKSAVVEKKLASAENDSVSAKNESTSAENDLVPAKNESASAEKVLEPAEKSFESGENASEATETGAATAEAKTESNDSSTGVNEARPERREGRQNRTRRTEYSRQDRNEGPRKEGSRTDGSRNEEPRSEGTRSEGTRSEGARLENNAPDISKMDNIQEANGILEVMNDGFGFIRCDNYMPGTEDVYVAQAQIRKFNLKTGDIIVGKKRFNNPTDKFAALMVIDTINGYTLEEAAKRNNFEDLTPIFPDERIKLERVGSSVAMRIVDLVSPIGKGQRGMIVAQPKAGKTTLLKEVAKSVTTTHPDMHMIILLIDERPEEVTDMKEAIEGDNVEVIYSTFDETPEHHRRVAEMVIERAKRLVEHGQDVMILLDSITRLARAYNLTVQPSGRTLSGGLDPAALHMPKRFFGAARNMREGGSLTILATALVNTGSKMDDVVYEEFKGTGNMELILDRKLSEKRVFPAIDITQSGTRREDLLLTRKELEAINIMRKAINGMKKDEAVETILNMFAHTKNNAEYIDMVIRKRVI